MEGKHTVTRRNVLKTGIATAAGVSAVTPSAYAAQFRKQPGETKIVCVMGDYWHSPVWQEQHIRSIFSHGDNYKVYFVLASRYLTAELLSDTDLLITTRYGGRDALGWTAEPIVGERPAGDIIWTDEHADAVCDNVKNRGMAFLAAHCTLFCGNEKIEDLMGIEPQLHQEMQPMVHTKFNQDHPITNGFDTYYIVIDDQFGVDFKYPERTTILFRSQAVHDKREMISAWCIEQGNGRVVGLLPGDHNFTYRMAQYREIVWRSAHWAMKRDIPQFPDAAKDDKGFY